MAADTAPEVARAPLEPLCLSLRSALPLEVSLATAASQLVTPPTPDALRGAVCRELLRRRCELAAFIEDDFDAYVGRMQQAHTWGGGDILHGFEQGSS